MVVSLVYLGSKDFTSQKDNKSFHCSIFCFPNTLQLFYSVKIDDSKLILGNSYKVKLDPIGSKWKILEIVE